MRVAWFSPRPPARSGIATYTAEVVPRLAGEFTIDSYVDRPGALLEDHALDAHDFVWRHLREPYDLVVYQLGNAPCHDYMWAYLARYPGLVVLHDARLHHARARQLLARARFDDYRAEFCYDHPDANQDFVEYAIEGLGGPIYYFWSMLRVVMNTARLIAVHNSQVASQLRDEYPDTPIETIRMGVPPLHASAEARGRVRRSLDVPDRATVFAAFGRVTPEKRLCPMLRALGRLVAEDIDAYLMIVGDATEYVPLAAELARETITHRVRVTGYVPDGTIGEFLAAADVCLCLRWPTALETSASWLRCLAAARPTVITELAHLTDIPTIEPRTWRASRASVEPVAVGIDLLDEDESLLLAMRRLALDAPVRGRLARAGHRYWSTDHTLERMAADYRRLMTGAAARPSPLIPNLPAHFTRDYAELARQIARQLGVEVDICG